MIKASCIWDMKTFSKVKILVLEFSNNNHHNFDFVLKFVLYYSISIVSILACKIYHFYLANNNIAFVTMLSATIETEKIKNIKKLVSQKIQLLSKILNYKKKQHTFESFPYTFFPTYYWQTKFIIFILLLNYYSITQKYIILS